MTDKEIEVARTKAVERVIRTVARNQGLHFRKSRTRNERAVDYGTYGLVDENNVLVEGDTNTGYGLSLDVVAAKVGLSVEYLDGSPHLIARVGR